MSAPESSDAVLPSASSSDTGNASLAAPVVLYALTVPATAKPSFAREESPQIGHALLLAAATGLRSPPAA